MFSSKSIFTIISAAAAFSSVKALTGRASVDSLGTTPCPIQCTPTDFRAALPADQFPNGENCCQTVHVSFEGASVDVTFTDLFLAGVGSNNISLSHQAFAVLAPPELGQIFPVEWSF